MKSHSNYRSGAASAAAIITVAAFGMPGNIAKAALIAEDGFGYAPGAITTEGGSGWASGSTWNGGQSVAGSFTYPGVGNSGANKYSGTGNVFRSLNLGAGSVSSSLGLVTAGTLGMDSTTLWMSFIGQRQGGGYAGVSLYGGGSELIFFGSNGINPDWGIGNEATTAGTPADSEAYILVKMEFGAANNNDTFSMWSNPDLSTGESGLGTANATSSVFDVKFDEIRLGTASTLLVDELRLGTTFADAVPEPSSLSLVALGGLALLRRRRA